MRMTRRQLPLLFAMQLSLVTNVASWSPASSQVLSRPARHLSSSTHHQQPRTASVGPPPTRRRAASPAICRAAANIKGVDSWEAEFSTLKAPMPSIGAPSGQDLLGSFGNMIQGFAGGGDQKKVAQSSRESDIVRSGPSAEAPALDGYEVVAEYPHVKDSFTQGLWWSEDEQKMYEGSGGPSFSCGTRLTRYDLETGEISDGRQLPTRYFGEGICGLGDKIYQLSWRTNVGFVYDRKTLSLVNQWKYDYEGWGMTTDGQSLIVSDGTATLHFLDPVSLKETKSLVVRARGFKSPTMAPVRRLNDIQFVKGEILANIWESDRIAVIEPESGVVKRFIECKGLVDEGDPWIRQWNKSDRCLNGIAYDEARDRLLVTGKLWTTIYEIKVLPSKGKDMGPGWRSSSPYGNGGGFDPLGMGG